jgi:selenocysteine-specific translation elongation factor
MVELWTREDALKVVNTLVPVQKCGQLLDFKQAIAIIHKASREDIVRIESVNKDIRTSLEKNQCELVVMSKVTREQLEYFIKLMDTKEENSMNIELPYTIGVKENV